MGKAACPVYNIHNALVFSQRKCHILCREQLLKNIEKIRVALYELAKGKSLTDPEVVQMSQRLDRMLNEDLVTHQKRRVMG